MEQVTIMHVNEQLGLNHLDSFFDIVDDKLNF